MANWAHVEDGEIKGRYDLLPKNWRSVSGLNLSENDLPFLKSLGWYPVFKEGVIYDESTHFISGHDYQLDEDKVLEIPILSEKPKAPEVDFAVLKEQFMVALREERNKKLFESDWTQFNDVQNLFDEETKMKWLTYRQELRDITQIYSNDGTVDVESVIWPMIPE